MKQWTIIYRPHYSAWFGKCGEELQDEILAHLEVLKAVGPNLGRPRVDHIKGSAHQNMKELRVQLLGGAKTGDDRWYRRNVPLADQEFSLHLREMHMQKKKDKEKKR